jgi:hypothetical protein
MTTAAITPANARIRSRGGRNRNRAGRDHGGLTPGQARARYMQGRRSDARAHGYQGPLTRAEASAAQLAYLARRAR